MAETCTQAWPISQCQPKGGAMGQENYWYLYYIPIITYVYIYMYKYVYIYMIIYIYDYIYMIIYIYIYICMIIYIYDYIYIWLYIYIYIYDYIYMIIYIYIVPYLLWGFDLGMGQKPLEITIWLGNNHPFTRCFGVPSGCQGFDSWPSWEMLPWSID